MPVGAKISEKLSNSDTYRFYNVNVERNKGFFLCVSGVERNGYYCNSPPKWLFGLQPTTLPWAVILSHKEKWLLHADIFTFSSHSCLFFFLWTGLLILALSLAFANVVMPDVFAQSDSTVLKQKCSGRDREATFTFCTMGTYWWNRFSLRIKESVLWVLFKTASILLIWSQ